MPGHLPLKLTLSTAPLKQRITVVKIPKPIEEIAETTEETCSEKAAELANEKREEIEQALRDGHDDQAWSLVSAVAESYLEWRCSSGKSNRRKEEKEGVESKKRKNVSWQPVLEKDLVTVQRPSSQESCRSQEDRQWREIQTKLHSRKAEEIDTRMQIDQLWSKIKKVIEKNRVLCQPLCKCMFPAERDVQWFLNRGSSNDQEDRQGCSRAKDSELAQYKGRGSQQKNELQRCEQRLEGALEFHQERKSATDHCGC